MKSAARVIVRTYGRDSVLVWANLLLAPLLAFVGLRVGLQSEERLAATMEADAAVPRKRGYLVAKVETFSRGRALTCDSVPLGFGIGADDAWQRSDDGGT